MITRTHDAAPNFHHVADGHITEQYHGLVEWIRSSTNPVEAEAQLIGVAGCARKVGASTVAANLAAAAAQSCDRPVLLLDLSGTNFLLTERSVPADDSRLSGVFSERAPFVNASPIPNLSWLTLDDACAQCQNAEGRDVGVVLRELQHEFGFIVIDLPPADSWRSFAVAATLHGVVLVVDAQSARQAAMRTTQGLARANAIVLGVILNNYRRDIPSWLDARP